MLKDVNVEEGLNLENPLFIDVRSESEFKEASIPGAVNLPVLNDLERKQVGEIYHREGPGSARKLALDLVSPKLPFFIRQIDECSHKRSVILFCWRGGLRSRSLGVICDLMGIPVYRLVGGYKSYRQLVRNYLWKQSLDREVVVLHGLTGVGKTEILQILARRKLAVIDLEALASNRGSVFGGIGLPAGPNQKMFEAYLAQKLWEQAGHSYVLVECESRRIGRNTLPTPLLEGMRAGRHILLYDSLENRIQRLVREYTDMNSTDLTGLSNAVWSLKNRLGTSKTIDLIKHLNQEDFDLVTRELLLSYYDPLYKYPSEPSAEYDLCVETSDIMAAAKRIETFVRERYGE